MARAFASLLAASVAAAVVVTGTPAVAAEPPAPVTGLTVKAGDGQVVLRWTNPAGDFAGVTVVHKEGATAPATVDDGTAVVVAAPATTVTVKPLTNNTAYAFSVFSRNSAGDLSAPVARTATPVPAVLTKLTIAVSPKYVTYGGRPVVSAKLVRADGVAVAGEKVRLYRKPAGASAFSAAYSLTTNAAGVVSVATMPAKNTAWYATHAATPYFDASTSPTTMSYVKPKVSVTRTPAYVEQNQPSTIRVAVSPAHPGQQVLLQRVIDGEWRGVGERYLSSTSTAAFVVKTDVIGTRTYRVVKPKDADHATAYTASFRVVTVRRTLRSGMSGADVLKVEKRLAALRYDPAALDGYYSYDTVHAVMAFQKVNRLPVTGNVDRTTYAKLWNQVTPRLRYVRSGNWVEADLTKQVLYYVRNGAISRILDISSGNNELFTVDGETHRATTPTGSFRIFHKINGMRVSRLGSLWKPAYFASGGYAIHGSNFVPSWPDSHGCIRITNPAMDRLFPLLEMGMSVYVYRS